MHKTGIYIHFKKPTTAFLHMHTDLSVTCLFTLSSGGSARPIKQWGHLTLILLGERVRLTADFRLSSSVSGSEELYFCEISSL